MSPEMLLNDDIVISGYLSLHNIERRIFSDLPHVNFVMEGGVRKRTDAEISINMDKFFQRMNIAINKCKELGMYSTTEPMNVNETIFGVSAIIVIAVFIVICICIYLIYYQT
jgi:hypothetical protein